MKILSKILSYIFIAPVKLYQLTLSKILPDSCRHIPSCSHYTIEAFKTHGIFRGLILSANRILRCNPFGTEGYDPVPPKVDRQTWKNFRKSTKMYFNPNNYFFDNKDIDNAQNN